MTEIRLYRGAIPRAPISETFPLSVNGRYLQTAGGQPFWLQGDTAWSIAAQLDNEEIDTYLDDRQAKGYTAILFNAIEHFYTSQSPEYENADGVAPFETMTDFGSALNEDYWSRVDYIVNGAKERGIVCVINPAYFGFQGGQDGWYTAIQAESDADLQSYGQRLAERYTQGNVLWCLGGDYEGANTAARVKQWQIMVGIRSVRTSDLVMVHPGPNTPGYEAWDDFDTDSYPGLAINTVYAYPESGFEIWEECLTEYARSGPIPFIMFEARYEQENGVAASQLRRQWYHALTNGACGHFFGNNPIWHFESPNTIFAYSGTWESNLDSTGNQEQAIAAAFVQSLPWWKLAPVTDTSLVTTSLGTGSARICPALASDGTSAVIWKPSSGNVTVDMSALSVASIRARFFDPTDGTYASVSGSPFENSGTEVIAFPGERVLVLDAA